MIHKRVGYCWSERKGQRINADQLEKKFIDKGYEFIKIDLDKDLEQQGPFDAIIHKLSELLCNYDDNARRQIQNFENYIEAHPEIIVIDRLDNIRKILDRYRQYMIIEESELAKEDKVFIPSFVELTSNNLIENLEKLKSANVKFPIVCKSINAQGTPSAHKMWIVFEEDGLKSIKFPCIAQTFINHNARLFKLFTIKDKYFIVERPSIKNFKPDQHYQTIYFDSHDISKSYSSSALIELDEDDKCNRIIEPEIERLDRIVKILFDELGLYLLSVDVIIENDTGRYAIIDMNIFPGYDGVHNFLDLYCNVVIEEIELKNNKNSINSIKLNSTISTNGNEKQRTNNNDIQAPPLNGIYTANDFDSGIDTSDSCDEKKHPLEMPLKFYRKQHCRLHQQTQPAPLNNIVNNNVSENNNSNKCD